MSNDRVIDRIEQALTGLEGLEVAFSKEYPPVAARTVPADDLRLTGKLKRYLKEAYPGGLFTHQHMALALILSGRHTVVTTPTSSGKSLIFTVPALNAYMEDSQASSLFIYPQKSLANDQLGQLRQMFASLTGEPADPKVISRYDGATKQEYRSGIREHGQFVLTNPDMVHYSLLQYHDKWARFFQQLRFVIIDEAHAYRGIFGSSVAYILRRLRAVCKIYNSDPVFISTSATIHQPTEHLEKLTGLDFTEVGPEHDGSMQGRKKIWLVQSSAHHYHTGRTVTRRFVDNDLNCLTFCPSRLSAEQLLADIPENQLAEGKIRVYRAGLDAGERERIEAGMKTGQIKGVFSTSALELGIDMGVLDVVVCVGLPNTMMSLWQRAGRVGRGGKEGGIVLIAADAPYDTYFAQHPEEFFDRENEPLAVNLQNRRLVCHHVACAIQESRDEDCLDLECLGQDIEHALELRRQGRLNAEVFYSDDPHMRTPIRNSGDRNYTLIDGDEAIGEIDPWHLIREAYPHAIYRHGGLAYRVRDIRKSNREIHLSRDFTRNVTIPVVKKSVYTRRIRAVTQYARITVKMADFEVTERLVAVQEENRSGEQVKCYQGNQGLSPHRLPTQGISIELTPQLSRELGQRIRRSSPAVIVRAIERLIRGLFPVISGPCDVMDYNTHSDTRDERITWYLYDQVHDGMDLTVQAYGRIQDLLAKAMLQVGSCPCTSDEGCFRCIIDPEEKDIASKSDCARVLKLLGEELADSQPREQVFSVDVLEEHADVKACPRCDGRIRYDDKFCSSCGERLEG